MLFSKYADPVTDGGRKLLALKRRRCGAVIVAAGNASRMAGVDKIMAKLGDEPLIAKTVRAFQQCAAISEIVVVTREDLILPVKNACREFDKVTAVVCGGKDRAESVDLGLNALSHKVRLAAIHDGARPLITSRLIDRTVAAANTFGAAAPAVPVKDTVKIAKGGVVQSTPERKTLFAVQTPQVFDYDMLRAALKHVRLEGIAITDDCSALESLGMKVKLIDGDEQNLKVTTPMDLAIAGMLLEEGL